MGKYIYKPYLPLFAQLFKKEKERIQASFPALILIEHVGSTAVPNLGGKGIIDIAIAVPQHQMETVKSQIETLGYEYRASFSTPDRYYFIIYLSDPNEGSRRYHIHLTYPESLPWKELKGFRDYLLKYPEEAKLYASLKKKAAESCNQEGTLYQKMKAPFIQRVLSTLHTK